jgi:hypothetical protein
VAFLGSDASFGRVGSFIGLVLQFGPTPLLSCSTGLEASEMPIVIVVVAVFVLLSVGMKIRRGSFFRWRARQDPNA